MTTGSDPAGVAWQSLAPGTYRTTPNTPVIATPEIGAPPASFGTAGSYPIGDQQFDGAVLQEDLVRALGRDVAITVTSPSRVSAGQLRITDPTTGAPLNVDSAVVARVVAEHAPAETVEARFLREFDAATTIEAKLDAVRDHIARQADVDERARHLQRRRLERANETPRVGMSMADAFRPPVPPRVTSRNPWTKRGQQGKG